MASPIIGLSTLYKLGGKLKDAVVEAVNHGLSVVEIVDDGLHALNKRHISKLNELSESYNMHFSVHAPFADINVASPSPSLLNAMIRRLEKSLENAAALNAEVWILHPGLESGISMFYPGKSWSQNCRSINLLGRRACDLGVNIAVENLPEPYPFILKSVEHFRKFYEEIEVDVGLALDLGHANINGQIASFIELFADKIAHIHAHDNRGKVDEHLGIGCGTIDWAATVQLLKKIGFKKTIIVESITHVSESLEYLRKLFI